MAHRVLVVDDEPSIRLTLSEFLRREGFEVRAAADAAQGSNLFTSDGGVDVAVVDINLPGRGGIELLREMREQDPRVPVIIITGEPNVSHLPEIVRAGAYDFLAKPVLKDTITRAVARAAEKKRLDDEKRRLEEEVRRYNEELERRVAERTADLAAAHSFLNLVLDSSTEYAIVVLDLGYNVTLFNRGAELMFGYTAEEAKGRRPRDLYLDVERYGQNVLLECLREADAVGLYRTEMILHRRDGEEFPARVALTPIVGGGEMLGHLCVMRDLTAERQAEESLRRMQARLAHQEKIAELGRVAAQVAHEVKNPLTGLQLYSMHMKSKLADRMSEAELQLADRIITTINHLSQTVEQIVNFARPLSLERREVDLNRVVIDLLQLLEHQLTGAQVTTHTELSEEPLRGRLDESSLRAALTNLLVNAQQAMNGGGRLDVKTAREGRHFRVEIADTGVGMSREQVERMFEAFYTTKAKGLGLGLPYAKKVIEEHGGELNVESSPGEGTRVSVLLPSGGEGA